MQIAGKPSKTQEVWAALNARLERPRRALRTPILAARGFFRDEIFHHASALAFDTVLALVPMLVIAFATLRGLGAYDSFLHGTVRPWIDHTFGPASPNQRATLREAFVQLLELGEGVNVGALGLVGVLLLLYLVVVLLITVETTFNRIWGVQRPRGLVRKASDFAAILFVIPIAMLVSTTLAPMIGRGDWLGPMKPTVELVASMLAASAAFTFLYLVMPHTRVRLRSAMYGALIAGVLWGLGLWGYSTFQIGVARYNVLYSGFAALPLFFAWVFVSWIIVLYGAEIAAAHQSPEAFRWRIRHREASPATRHRLAVRFALDVARAFVLGEQPPTRLSLAKAGCVPERLALELLDQLVDAGLLLHSVSGGEAAYAMAVDPKSVRLTDVLRALDHTEDPKELSLEAQDEEAGRVAVLLQWLDGVREHSPLNATLHDLAVGEMPQNGETTHESSKESNYAQH